MNRRIVWLNLALLALAGALVWILRANWIEAKARERVVLERKVAAKAVLAPPALPGVKPVAPAEYVDVASKMLFSKDRNPTVMVEPPKPPPEPVMPALPTYHGQMAIGEPVILLSTGSNGAQRSYHAGDQIGDFKLVSFDESIVDFEWKGKNVERKLEQLRPKETVAQATPAAGQGSPPSASTPASGAAATPVRPVASLDHPSSVAPAAVKPSGAGAPVPGQAVTSLSGSSDADGKSSAADTSGDSTFGPLLPTGDRSCLPSDHSPVGTVHSGFMKVQSMGIFGASCSWTEVK